MTSASNPPSSDEERPGISPGDLILVVLVLAWGFNLARPALMYLSDLLHVFRLNLNFHIPTNQSVGMDLVEHDDFIRQRLEGSEYSNSYPPLMTLVFGWVRLFSTREAMGIWCLCVVGMLGWLTAWWMRVMGRGGERGNTFRANLGTWTLLVLSYPPIFAFERGNNDVLVLLCVSLGAWCMLRRAWLALGMLLSLAALLKVYPAAILGSFGVAAIVAAALGSPRTRTAGGHLLAGELLGAVLVLVPTWRDQLTYFTQTLPHFAKDVVAAPGYPFAHSMTVTYGKPGLIIMGLLWLLATVPVVTALFRFMEDPDEKPLSVVARPLLYALTLLIATSLYVATTSYDYNLILEIPLLIALICSRSEENPWQNLGTVLLTAGYALPRWLNEVMFPEHQHNLFLDAQVAGLAMLVAFNFQVSLQDIRQWLKR